MSYGGSYEESLEKYILAPFRQKTGIAVSLGVNSTLAGLKVQIASGQSEWDLVEVAGGEFIEGIKENLFEPLDFSIINSAKYRPSPKANLASNTPCSCPVLAMTARPSRTPTHHKPGAISGT